MSKASGVPAVTTALQTEVTIDSGHYWQRSLLTAVTTDSGHHRQWSLQTAVTTDSGHYRQRSLQTAVTMYSQRSLQTAVTTASGHYSQRSLHTAVTTASGHYREWSLVLQTVVTTDSGHYRQWSLQTTVTTASGHYKQRSLHAAITTSVVGGHTIHKQHTSHQNNERLLQWHYYQSWQQTTFTRTSNVYKWSLQPVTGSRYWQSILRPTTSVQYSWSLQFHSLTEVEWHYPSWKMEITHHSMHVIYLTSLLCRYSSVMCRYRCVSCHLRCWRVLTMVYHWWLVSSVILINICRVTFVTIIVCQVGYHYWCVSNVSCHQWRTIDCVDRQDEPPTPKQHWNKWQFGADQNLLQVFLPPNTLNRESCIPIAA